MDSLFSLAGKKAVITGCATGIGKGMAAGLARAGADIIALDIGDLEDTRRTVENLGRECRCYHVDLSVSSDVDEVWIRLLEEAGHVDILCNNAGMQFRKNAFEYPEEMFDKVIAYDHLKQKIGSVVNMRTGRPVLNQSGSRGLVTINPPSPDSRPKETQYLEYLMKEYGRACGEIEAIASLIHETAPLKKLTSGPKPVFTCNVSKKAYCDIVKKTKEYILEGDIFQAVISRQFASPCSGSLLNAYRVLRTTNPSPYMVYMNIDDDEIISTSPETLIRLKDGRLTTFPVAGSRPRGATDEEDRRLEKELLADEKELSEHNMLVDLGRNDIGRIASFDSVEVTEYKMIHRYSKIMHICSQVEGDIKPGYDGCSAIEALLPAGTLSGAPKIRACQIIEELEQAPRGIYGGALGYLDFTGNLDTCIAIRMAVKQNGTVIVQSGGGIVADSVPEKEYEESENKAMAVMNAIENAGEVDDK